MKIRVNQRFTQCCRRVPCGRLEAWNVAHVGTRENVTRRSYQGAAFATRLSLELFRHVRPGMRMRQSVQRDVGARQPVQIGGELREAIDAKRAGAVSGRPVNALAEYRDARQPSPSGYQMLEPPIGSYEQSDAQLRKTLEQPRESPECAVAEVTAGVEATARGRWVHIVNSEAHRASLVPRKPSIAAGKRQNRLAHACLLAGWLGRPGSTAVATARLLPIFERVDAQAEPGVRLLLTASRDRARRVLGYAAECP
jgi:hypothetical protein